MMISLVDEVLNWLENRAILIRTHSDQRNFAENSNESILLERFTKIPFGMDES